MRDRIGGSLFNYARFPNTIRISTWGELQDALYTDAWQAKLERFRPSIAFRGIAHAQDEVTNSHV